MKCYQCIYYKVKPFGFEGDNFCQCFGHSVDYASEPAFSDCFYKEED